MTNFTFPCKKSRIIIASILLLTCSNINAQIGLYSDLNQDGRTNIQDVSLEINLITGKATDAAVEAGLCPDVMHPHAINMGLPSGTKWTCCNVGATKPTEYGGHFAWAETLTKNEYGVNTYFYYDDYEYVNLAKDIAGTICDVATVKWGESYSIPTLEQYKELVNNCSSSWTTIGGVNGRLFVASNRHKIFIPANGRWSSTNFLFNELEGFYWLSTRHENNVECAYHFGFSQENTSLGGVYTYRYFGQGIRPVSK